MTTTFRKLLLFLTGVTFIGTIVIVAMRWTGTTGLVMENSGGPAGGDFINLWTAGKMVIEGRTGDIYDPTAFLEYQQTLVSEGIGFRIWAYPPHSLLLAVPFALFGYWAALSLWSILGLGLLTFGARRFGFDWVETVILVLSPAALMCVYYGQTGNLAGGLLLLALSRRSDRDGIAVGATSVLTIKPQLGFMIPILWAMDRRWKLIGWTIATSILLYGAATLAFGIDAWDGYLTDTIPALNDFERNGTGPFEWMIPSFFMAIRILTGNGDLAANIHLVIAVGVLAVTVFHLWKSRHREQRAALLLIGTATITPYLHIYDMSLLVAAAFLLARMWGAAGEPNKTAWGERAVIIAWAMPLITYGMNAFGLPISPILLVGLLVLAIKAPIADAASVEDPTTATIEAADSDPILR